MNFFMYSKCGEGAGLLKKIEEEGNNVSLYIEEGEYANVFDGILPKTDYPSEGDIVIFDSSGLGAKADALRDSGFKVFGASRFHDKLEDDRDFGLKFMQDNGIMIPDTESFNKFKDGIKFIQENDDKKFVFKPSGKNIPSKLTYSSSDAEDLMIYMQFIERHFGKEIDSFILQEFIKGAIIEAEYWVGARGFIKPINYTIEVKKLMNDDIGPSTGCSGNIVWQGKDDSDLAEALQGVEEELVKNNFIGCIALNCIITESGIYGLEWTPRFGLDAMPTLLQLIEGDVGKLIFDIASGLTPKMSLYPGFSGGARLTIPPYPMEPESMKELQNNSPNIGIPIRGLEDYDSYCYFYEVMMQDDLLVHSSGTGVIACISSLGDDPEECFEVPYQILEDCKIPDKQYRTDLGKVLSEMYDEVEEVLDEVWT